MDVPVLCNWLRKGCGFVAGVLETAPGIAVPRLAVLSTLCICAASYKGQDGEGSSKLFKGRPIQSRFLSPHVQHGIVVLSALPEGPKSHPCYQVQVTKAFRQGRGCIRQVYQLGDLSRQL